MNCEIKVSNNKIHKKIYEYNRVDNKNHIIIKIYKVGSSKSVCVGRNKNKYSKRYP